MQVRLVTKINIFFIAIIAILMMIVFAFTINYFHNQLDKRAEGSLAVSYDSFLITLNNIYTEQLMKIVPISDRDIIRLTAKDHLVSVLHYYLKTYAEEYNANLLEVIDTDGFLLADSNTFYPKNERSKITFSKPSSNDGCLSYLSLRQDKVYFITTTPIVYLDKVVGYLNLGSLFDLEYAEFFASTLHAGVFLTDNNNKVLLSSDNRQVPGNNFLPKYQDIPANGIFCSGLTVKQNDYHYYYFPLNTDDSFKAIMGISYDCAENHLAMIRMEIFLLFLMLCCFIFGGIGTNLLAQNIKKMIFGMEPHEIASLLEQQTVLLQSTFEGIIGIDRNGKVTLINEEAKRLLPTVTEPINKLVTELLPNLDISDLLESGTSLYNQHQLLGSSVVVCNCLPIKDKQQKILGAVITFRDLTEIKKVAEELIEVKTYTQALRAQSHEFMNKLQSISGLIQLGRNDTALTLLHETTAVQQDIISFLAAAFSTSAVSGILLGKFNRAKELNIEFTIDRNSKIPREAQIPDTELVSIVGNLIENAFDAVQSSPIQPKQVYFRIKPVGDFMKITVVDNGCGIKPELKEKIFQRGVTSKKGTDRGIGLSLVKQYIENLHGSINFRSGKFTVFSVKIPIINGGNTKNDKQN